MDALANLITDQSALVFLAALAVFALGKLTGFRVFYLVGFLISLAISAIFLFSDPSSSIVWLGVSIAFYCIFKLPVKEVIRPEYPSMM